MLSDLPGKKLNTYVPNYVLFDLETTGMFSPRDAVVEISAVKVKEGKIVDEFTTLVNPQRHIPSSVVRIHGISDDMVKDSPFFKEALADFLNFAEDEVLVGHNIQCFDLKFIYRDAETYWGKTVGNDFIDTLHFARKILKGIGSYSLGNLAGYYGISTEGAHRALNDCRMNQQVFECLAKEMLTLPQFCSGNGEGILRCPKCGSSLIKRNGRFGEFWGCLNYPNCKFTKDC